jgi:hypothetical protein
MLFAAVREAGIGTKRTSRAGLMMSVERACDADSAEYWWHHGNDRDRNAWRVRHHRSLENFS